MRFFRRRWRRAGVGSAQFHMPRPRKDRIDKVNVLLSDAQGEAVLERMAFNGQENVSDYVRQLIAKDLRDFAQEKYAAGLRDPEYLEWLAERKSRGTKTPPPPETQDRATQQLKDAADAKAVLPIAPARPALGHAKERT